MTFDFREAKRALRQTVHDTLGVSAQYQDSTLTDPVDVTVRWHTRAVWQGEMGAAGYAEVATAQDILLFDREALATAGVYLRRGGYVSFPEGQYFELDMHKTLDGPVTTAWVVNQSTQLPVFG